MFKGLSVRKNKNEDTAIKEPKHDNNFEKAMTPSLKKLNKAIIQDQSKTGDITKTVANKYAKRKSQANKENDLPFYSQGYQKATNTTRGEGESSQKKVFGVRKSVQSQKNILELKSISSKKISLQKDFAKLEEVPSEANKESDFDLYIEREYGDVIEEDLLKNQPDLSKCLQNTNIKRGLRSKMVDWMGQVFKHYEKKLGASKHVFFLSVSIMDMYFKYSKTLLNDSDLHLIGVTCVFLASKYHDYFHIPLKDLVKISQNELSADSIKAKEWEILQALNYNLSFDTCLTYLERIIYKNFEKNEDLQYADLEASTIKILEVCIHDNEFLDFELNTLALAVVCYFIKSLSFGSGQDFETFKSTEEAEKERLTLKKVLLSSNHIDIPQIEFCMYKINFIFQHLEKRYSDKTNTKQSQINVFEEDSKNDS